MTKQQLAKKSFVLVGCIGLVLGGSVSAARSTKSSGLLSHSQLVGRAVLPAATFRAGSAPSGAFFSAADRTTATNNGVTVTAAPAPALPAQPVQGFSALIPSGSDEWWGLTDNGFGTRGNSADAELWVQKVRPNFAPGGDGSVAVTGGFGLSDPKGFVPWKIVCDPTKGTALPDFDFNKLPDVPPALCGSPGARKLTGFDFDLESMQIDRDGTFWFGEEFGPFLLHTNQNGELLQTPIPLPGVKSPQNPTLTPTEQPTLSASRGFEGMAINPARTKLYPLSEGPVTGDDQRDIRINEFDIRRSRYTGKSWKIRMELRGAFVNVSALKKFDGTPAFASSPPAPLPGINAIGELTMINNSQAILIERDGGGDAPNAARFKKLFLVDLEKGNGGYVTKSMLVDLMAVPDPAELGKDGPYFRFPYTTIESVYPINDHTLALVNDNNFPFSNGRSFSKGGPLAADDNEFIVIGLDQRLKLDRRLAQRPAAGDVQLEESQDDDG
jgi:hypothetical protein